MIRLTGMNNKELIINCELIEKIDEVPETIITITNGNKYIVLDTPDEIIEKVIEFKKRIFSLNR